MRARVRERVRERVRAGECVRAHARACVSACVRVSGCVRMRARACRLACGCVRACACARARAQACVRACGWMFRGERGVLYDDLVRHEQLAAPADPRLGMDRRVEPLAQARGAGVHTRVRRMHAPWKKLRREHPARQSLLVAAHEYLG
jgi:hypothetical protein